MAAQALRVFRRPPIAAETLEGPQSDGSAEFVYALGVFQPINRVITLVIPIELSPVALRSAFKEGYTIR